jgi:hypothetical protein
MLGAGLLLGLAGAIGAFAWWGWHLFVSQATAAMAVQPVVAERIGHIRQVDVDWSATTDEPDEDTFVFHLRGDRGSGTVVARFVTEDADHERIDGGKLRMDDGSELALGPQGGHDTDDDQD